MTIVTKPNISAVKTLEKPLVASEVGGEYVDHTVVDPQYGDVEAWPSPTARRRLSTVITICMSIIALSVISVGIVGGVYLYRQFSGHKKDKFQTWCGVPYDQADLPLIGSPRVGQPKVFQPEEDAEWTVGQQSRSMSMFQEEVKLDVEEDNYADIWVPDFGLGHEGRFVHDFNVSRTAIIDEKSQLCFVMPLEHKYVMHPRVLRTIMERDQSDFYKVDPGVVRLTMRVVGLATHEGVGIYISQHCASFPILRLERFIFQDKKKRSVDDTFDSEVTTFVEFAGTKIIRLDILNDQQHSQP